MSYTKFLELLEKHGAGKFDVRGGLLRDTENRLCPVCFLAKALGFNKGWYSNYDYINAGSLLGLTVDTIHYIVDGADGSVTNEARTARKDLQIAVGVTAKIISGGIR